MNDVEQTIGKIADELAALGVQRDQDLLVHSSLRQIGSIPGGPASLLAALRRVIGRNATVVVPTQTTANSLSSRVFRAATAGLGRAELRQFIEAMPGFDAASTPSLGMGAFAEYVRTLPGAIRSAHPQSSFAAVGPGARDCTADHALTCHLGERSPLGWLYRSGAAILLLGVGYEACTAFHLAEYRLAGPPVIRTYRCFISAAGLRQSSKFEDIRLDDGDFDDLGEQIDGMSFVRHGRVGTADSRLLPIKAAVDFVQKLPSFVARRRPSDVLDGGRNPAGE